MTIRIHNLNFLLRMNLPRFYVLTPSLFTVPNTQGRLDFRSVISQVTPMVIIM